MLQYQQNSNNNAAVSVTAVVKSASNTAENSTSQDTSIPMYRQHTARNPIKIEGIGSDPVPVEEVLKQVQPDDVCLFWYFGTNGLKEGTVTYYRPILQQVIQAGARACLVDLSPWASLKDSKKTITATSSKRKIIENVRHPSLQIVCCAAFFQALQGINSTNNPALLQMLQEIAKRPEHLEASKEFKENGIKLADIFGRNCPALEPVFDLDCGKIYSLLQYFELLFLVEQVMRNNPNSSTIRFVLPNDEAKYYSQCLLKDLPKFLLARNVPVTQPFKLIIHCFNYGDERFHRPYNHPSRNLPKPPTIEQVAGLAMPAVAQERTQNASTAAAKAKL